MSLDIVIDIYLLGNFPSVHHVTPYNLYSGIVVELVKNCKKIDCYFKANDLRSCGKILLTVEWRRKIYVCIWKNETLSFICICVILDDEVF